MSYNHFKPSLIVVISGCAASFTLLKELISGSKLISPNIFPISLACFFRLSVKFSPLVSIFPPAPLPLEELSLSSFFNICAVSNEAKLFRSLADFLALSPIPLTASLAFDASDAKFETVLVLSSPPAFPNIISVNDLKAFANT